MKIKVAILGMTVACVAGSVMAQENDDMYFNSKDRAKLNSTKADQKKTEALAYVDNEASTSAEDEDINTTDSYSARNVNPEFTSRSNSELAQEDDENYFVNDYRFANANELSQFDNNYNNWYSSQWYNSGYYGRMNAFNSPYYNSFASPWGSPYQSGWYGGISFYSGSPWGYNSGWGYDPWSNYGYGNYGGGYYGGGYYGGGSYWGGGGYYGGGNTVIIVEGGRGQAYGKRGERGGMTYYRPDNSAPNRRSAVVSRGSSSGNSGGRVSTNNTSSGRVATSTNTGRTQDEYYNRQWRNTRTNTGSGSGNSSWNNSGNGNGRSSSWGGGNSSSTPSRTSTFESGGNSNSRSYGSGSSSGGSRSSGSSSSGSGSGGRTRGRD
jgi:hypothetical protein